MFILFHKFIFLLSLLSVDKPKIKVQYNQPAQFLTGRERNRTNINWTENALFKTQKYKQCSN